MQRDFEETRYVYIILLTGVTSKFSVPWFFTDAWLMLAHKYQYHVTIARNKWPLLTTHFPLDGSRLA